MKKCVLTLAAAAAVLFGTTSPASAQSTTRMPTFELSAGYQWLKSFAPTETGVDQTFPVGLAIDGVRNFGALGIVAEGGWSMDSDDTDPNDLMFNLFHVAGGVRYSARKHARFWPYAQVLAGAAIDHTSGDIGGVDIDSTTNTHFMLQPGGGVTWVAGDGWGIVGAVDYRRIFLDEETDGASGQNQVRVFVGVRMILD